MRTRTNKTTTARKGNVTLETALLMPMFILLLFVSLEMGRALWIKHVLTEAAAEGARLAILNEPTDAEVTQAVRDILASQGVTQGALVDIGAREAGQPVDVVVTSQLDLLVLPNGLSAMIGSDTLTGASRMTHTY